MTAQPTAGPLLSEGEFPISVTPTEKSSLRTALVISLAIYTALFLTFALVSAGRPAHQSNGAAILQAPLLVSLTGGGHDGRYAPRPAATVGLPPRRPSVDRQQPVQSAGATVVAKRSSAPRHASNPSTVDSGNAEKAAAATLRRHHVQSVPSPGAGAARPVPPVASAAASYGRNTLGSGRNDASHSQQDLQQPGNGYAADGKAAGGGSSSVAAILATIRRRIIENRVYPSAAERRGIQGSVTVAATVRADGTLVRSRVVRSSGSQILDTAGIELLREVFPIDNPLGRNFTVEIPITYRLDNAG